MQLPFNGAISAFYEDAAPEEDRVLIREAGKNDILSPSYPYAERMRRSEYEDAIEPCSNPSRHVPVPEPDEQGPHDNGP